MAADVMAPGAVQYITGHGGETGLIGQAFPGDVAITRESNRITASTNAAITTKTNWSEMRLVRIAHLVIPVQLIYPRQGIETGNSTAFALLPVHPPSTPSASNGRCSALK